ncbi:MAG TPA: amidase [Thermohalobaculum sp.]|nr:amidase [Thermohalobaculum sp.]
MADLCALPAAEQARLVRAREASPVDLVEAALGRIALVQPALNAFAFVYPEEARAAAREAEAAVMRGDDLGPLHGLPVAFKDFTPTMGQRTTRGSRCFEHWVAEADPVIVRRFKAAGAIIVGKTTTPEFAHSGFTMSPLWGVTRNPWDPERNSGGSSGGAGVAATTGCVALAEGTDMGGSVRIPAALSGCVGLKPSLGRIPMDILPFVFDSLSHFGPLARTVGDAALFLRVAEGPDDADIQSQPVPAPLPERLDADLRGVSVALSPDLGLFAVEGEVEANLRATAEALRDAGASVEEVDLMVPHEVLRAWNDWWGVYLAACFGHLIDAHRAAMDPHVVRLMEAGLKLGAVPFKRIETVRTGLWHRLAAVLARHDALICPTMCRGAPLNSERDRNFWRRNAAGRVEGLDMTEIFNMVGQCPALSVPSGMTADGLPTAAQIVGRRFDDPTVLRIGAAIEARRPWRQWTPADLRSP